MKPNPHIAFALAAALSTIAAYAEEPPPAAPATPAAPVTPAPPGTQQIAPPPAAPPAGAPATPPPSGRAGLPPPDARDRQLAEPPQPGRDRRPESRLGDPRRRSPEGRSRNDLERGPYSPDDPERYPTFRPPDGGERDGDPGAPRRDEGGPRDAHHALRPFLGVITADLPAEVSAQLGLPEGFGLLVREVVPDSPAATAGVEKYDVLAAVDDQRLVSPDQLAKLVRSMGKDKTVALTVLRKGQEQHLSVKLTERDMPDFGGPIDGMRRLFGPRAEGGYGDDIREGVNALREKAEEWKDRAHEQAERVEEQARRAMDEAQRAQRRAQEQLNQSLPRARGPEVSPGELLREARPGGGARIQIYNQNGVTTVDGAKAHLSLKDNDGEIEVAAENGHRVLTARNPKNEVVFTGPVDTEEQRQAVPEQFRKKLDAIKILQETSSSTAQPGGGGAASSAASATVEVNAR